MLDDQVGVRSGAMVIAGAVGVGKSRLLARWLSEQEARGRPTVIVRATKSTATIPFGAFALWVPESLGDRGDRLGVLQATAARLAELGDGLVVAVDDAQLLDEGSAALVLHLVQHTPSGVVVTVRSESSPACPDAIVALWKERLAPRLDLQPLSEPETGELLDRAFGDRAAPATRRRLWELSQGNPLYLRELVAAGRGGEPADRTRLVELVSDRIGASGSAERRVLELIALGEPLPTTMLARLAPHDLLVRLEGRGLLVTDQQSPRHREQVVRLAHPVYSEVLRAELAAFTARSHCQALAEAALAVGAGRRDPLRVATWLLDSGGEPCEPELLLQASYMALLIDDYALSARLAEAAERAGGGWRATVRRAQALGPLQRWDDVEALLSGLSGPGNDPRAQAEATRVRAELSFWRRGEDLSMARATLAEAAQVTPAPARSTLLNQGAWLAILALDLDEAIRLATAAASDAGSSADRLNAVACAGFAAVLKGRTRDALAVVELATPYAFAVVGTDPAPGGFLAHVYSYASVLDGRLDEAATIYEVLRGHDAVRMGGPARGLPSFWLGRAAQAQGRVRTAKRLCQDALDVLGHANNAESGTWVAAALATAAAQSGDLGTAARAVAWIDAHRRVPTEPDALFTDLARAWLAASQGELSAAQDLCLQAADRAGKAGAALIELLALLDLARLGAPRSAADRLEELTHVVEGPYAAAAARFARALATGDGTGLDDAADRFASMGARLLAAEAAAAAASAHAAGGLRRSRTASIARAQQLAAECEGAVTPLLARLDHQPVVTTLTAREREVSGLAARGRTSREIADALSISVRTVDSHLDHAYTKLGITHRADLAAALGVAPTREAPSP